MNPKALRHLIRKRIGPGRVKRIKAYSANSGAVHSHIYWKVAEKVYIGTKWHPSLVEIEDITAYVLGLVLSRQSRVKRE